MRSKKLCYILLSALFITLGLSLNVCLDTSALRHEYRSIPLSNIAVPQHLSGYELDPSSNNYVLKQGFQLSPGLALTNSLRFRLRFDGDSYYEDLSHLSYKIPFSSFPLGYNGTNCIWYDSFSSHSGVYSLIGGSKTSTSVSFTGGYLTYYPDFYDFSNFYSPNIGWNNASPICQRYSQLGVSPNPSFDSSSFPITTYILNTTDLSTGVPSTFYQPHLRDYISSYMSDYWFSSDGFYTRSTAIDTDSGIHYNHSFSFSDIFNQPVKKFSELYIPLYSYDDYWLDGNNFPAGRVFEFSGAFDFDEPVSFHSDVDTNGSSFDILFQACDSRKGSSCYEEFTFPCTFNLRTVPGANDYRQLEYSCSGSLPFQTPYLFPTLRIKGAHSNSNDTPSTYVFETSGDWRFAGVFVTTDNDSTPGSDFGSVVHGSVIAGDAKNDMGSSDDNADWFSSLKNLFYFNMINPFTPIFSLFTSQESCAQIPTLSEFLHSEETQVCPFFSSRIRSVVTPVLGLSAMMLVFGFAVRWLGARSGNFFEDSGSIAPPGDFPAGSAGVKHVGWRRK